ncbi:MAG: hypothetical protein HC812_02275 [Leptolyngbya sp. RL_3_1]|nr:hypothetical protein [Leptolyngbya sp. RL_3_1]
MGLNQLEQFLATDWAWLIGTLTLLHCLVGLIAAKIAHNKGRNLGRWLAWGLIGGTPTLIAACLCASHPQSTQSD